MKRNNKSVWLCAEFAKLTFKKDEDLNIGHRLLSLFIALILAFIEPFVKLGEAFTKEESETKQA